MISLLVLALLACSALAHMQEPSAYVLPKAPGAYQAREESIGPVLRTGRIRVLQERILGGENAAPADAYNQVPPVQSRADDLELHTERPFVYKRQDVPEGANHYTYDGPVDGRKVYIYRRVQTPVRITNGVIERLGPGVTVDRWAEGGYKGAQLHNLEVYNRVGTDVYSDRVVPLRATSTLGGEFRMH